MRKLDRRIVRTRQALRKALVSLALEMRYDEISVRDLTKRAGIGYATFYRHYKSKDELLLQVLRAELRYLRTAMQFATSPFDEVVIMYRVVRNRQGIYRIAADLPEDNEARQAVWDDTKRLTLERYRIRESSAVDSELALGHLVRTGQFLLRWYLDHLDECSAGQMAEIFVNLVVRPVVKTAFIAREEWLSRFAARQDERGVSSEEMRTT